MQVTARSHDKRLVKSFATVLNTAGTPIRKGMMPSALPTKGTGITSQGGALVPLMTPQNLKDHKLTVNQPQRLGPRIQRQQANTTTAKATKKARSTTHQ